MLLGKMVMALKLSLPMPILLPLLGDFSKSDILWYLSGEGLFNLGQISIFLPNPIEVALLFITVGRS